MTDQAFETRLAAVLRADAQRAVRPIDPIEIATAAAGTAAGRRPWRLPERPLLAQSLRTAFLLLLLLLAVAASLWVLANGTRRQPIVQVPPSQAPADFAAGLTGTWLADQPAGMSVGSAGGPAHLSLVVDSNGASAFVASSIDQRERLPASMSAPAGDQLRFVARAAGDPVISEGATLRGCAAQEVGLYRAIRSVDGGRLSLSVIDDPCPSRAAVLSRTFALSLGGPSRGGTGVIDAFDPLFTVAIPSGSYSVDRTIDAMTVVQPVPEFQFLAWKDPQGFVDPCDIAAGRRDIEPGADAFVAYFRQLDGFTVDSVTETRVDGHRAVRLLVHANVDATCPSGGLTEFQPKLETSDRSWFLRTGDTDSLIVVEYSSSTTLMFEVLPAPHPLESVVIESIRFLEGLPTTP